MVVDYQEQLGGKEASPELIEQLKKASLPTLGKVKGFTEEDQWRQRYMDKIIKNNMTSGNKNTTSERELNAMFEEIQAVNIHGRIPARNLFDNAIGLYETALADRYITSGRRKPFIFKDAFLTFDKLFDGKGRIRTNAYYDDKLLGNAFIEALYLELVNLNSERTFRNILLNILAANNQQRTPLYAKIFNDKTTRGKRK